MDKTFAVMNGNVVINTIVAPDVAVAEEVTGFTCIEYWEYPVESGNIDFHWPWSGHSIPVSPSILFDAPARCGNQWSVTLLNEAFPTAFQRWGFQNQHSPKSFTKETDAFDIVITSLRKPVDALASLIIMLKIDTNNTDSVSFLIKEHETILESINDNKEHVSIFSFESLTQTPEQVIDVVGNILGITPKPINIDTLLLRLKTFGSGSHAFPVDNQDELDTVRAVLNQERFADLMTKANELYTKLLVFVKA